MKKDGFYEYGKEKKYIMIECKDDLLARLIIKLRHEGLTRKEFFRSIMLAFIEDNDFIDDFILSYKKEKEFFRKNRQEILNKERRQKNIGLKKFGLDPEEVEDIFDIIEQELDL